jgi:hypothetical protein
MCVAGVLLSITTVVMLPMHCITQLADQLGAYFSGGDVPQLVAVLSAEWSECR